MTVGVRSVESDTCSAQDRKQRPRISTSPQPTAAAKHPVLTSSGNPGDKHLMWNDGRMTVADAARFSPPLAGRETGALPLAGRTAGDGADHL